MMKHVGVKKLGAARDMFIAESKIPSPQGGEVLIKIHATAVNRADTLQRRGLYPAPEGCSDIIGLECSGEISLIGNTCSMGWKVGDKVMALLKGGGYAEYATVSERCVMRVPDCLDLTTAAAIPEAYLTGFQLLHLIGQLQKDDVVLLHAAASGVGSAVINMCKLVGATVIGTVGSKEKIKYCKTLGASYVFDRHDGPFGPLVKKACDEMKKPGVSLVLDCIGASYSTQNLDVLALDGRWVLYGLMGGADVENFPLRAILGKRITLSGTTLRTRSIDYTALLVKRFQNEVLVHFQKGSPLIPHVHKVFRLAEVADAHKMMEGNENSGKIVMTIA